MLYDLWRAACTTESCEETFKCLLRVYTCIIIGLLSLSLSHLYQVFVVFKDSFRVVNGL